MMAYKLTAHPSGVNYAVGILPRKWWWQIWLPAWHKGRGRYVTIGLWLVAFSRGY